MAFNNFSGTGSNGPGGPGQGGFSMPGIPMGQAAGQVDDITDIMVNYNERFKAAQPAMFRDELVALALAVLVSASKPNPLLVGPAGTGKTRVVEEIARLIAVGSPRVPTQLAHYTVWELPLSNLVAGAGIVGELEERVTKVVDYASDPANKAILFVDEIHLLQSSRDSTYNKIAQILKPALARGDMHLIGATTAQESRKLDDDPAFARRFSRLVVDELTRDQATEVARAALPALLDHYQYKVSVDDALLEKISTIADENSTSANHRPDTVLTLLDRAMADTVVAHATLIADAEDRGDKQFADQLRLLTPVPVTEAKFKAVAVRLMTGLAKKKVFDLQEVREGLKRIKGQDDILDDLADAMSRDSLGVFPRRRPAAWMFAGPSGVGKTEATKIIAEALTSQPPIMLNMGEYHTSHDASKLIGSGPGYVGSDSNKELPFDTLESNPYRVILLDEIEKADRTIHRLLLTALDEGWMRMASGKVVDFSKAVVIATTNAGRDAFSGKPKVGFSAQGEDGPAMSRAAVTKALEGSFDPEFLGRFSKVVAFHPLSREVYSEIVEAYYSRERERIAGVDPRTGALLPAAVPADDLGSLVSATYVPSQGARPAEQAVRAYIEDLVIQGQAPAAPLPVGRAAIPAVVDDETEAAQAED